MINVRNVVVLNKKDALEELARIGADRAGCRLMAPKAVHRLLKIYGLSPKQASILKQEMLSKGGEAAVARGVLDSSLPLSDVMLMGTLRQYDELIVKLKMQPFGMSSLAEQIKTVLSNIEGRPVIDMDCRGKTVTIGGRTLVMGILNVTPDSFSDGGRFRDPGLALEHALGMVEEGADIIDLGGESTRPGYTPVDPEEEKKRLLPVLKRLVREIPMPVSVDTCKAVVAEAALEEGAHIINDQWAFRYDEAMAGVAARFQVPVIFMHNQQGTDYQDLMGDIIDYFNGSIARGLAAGVARDKMIIDPGIGFGKNLEQNIEVMGRLEELKCLGLPVLIGTSRKSLIGKVLDLPPDQRVEGTAATVSLGIAAGADIVRVHDVRAMVRVVRMTDAIVRRRNSGVPGNG
jgi:dihydropteroate synthase